MISGRGDIATAIQDKDGYLFYVNGISNRLPTTQEAKAKEEDEVLSHCKTLKMFVYISTLSIYYSDSEYTKHKIRMEGLIKTNFRYYCIFRIGNIKWGDNPNTILNNLGYKIHHKHKIEIKDEYRYLIDREEFRHWISMIPSSGKHEMNCTGNRLKVKEIVSMIKDGKL